MQNVIEINA